LKVKKINKGFSKNIKIVIAIGLYSYVIRTEAKEGWEHACCAGWTNWLGPADLSTSDVESRKAARQGQG
jgi:hypothetical protein